MYYPLKLTSGNEQFYHQANRHSIGQNAKYCFGTLFQDTYRKKWI